MLSKLDMLQIEEAHALARDVLWPGAFRTPLQARHRLVVQWGRSECGGGSVP